MAKVHKVRVQHKCPECHNTFGEKGNLNRHIKSVQYVNHHYYKVTQFTLTPYSVVERSHTSAISAPWRFHSATLYSTFPYTSTKPLRPHILTQLKETRESGA